MGAEDGLCAWDHLAPIYKDQEPLVPANAETAPVIANCIKYAESEAFAPIDWACIAEAWLDFFLADGVKNAIRCASMASPEGFKCYGLEGYWWVSGATVWRRIAAYEPAYLPIAEEWLGKAEGLSEFPIPLECAQAWIQMPLSYAKSKAIALLELAENRPTDDDHYILRVCNAWSQCLGPDAGPRIQQYLFKMGCSDL